MPRARVRRPVKVPRFPLARVLASRGVSLAELARRTRITRTQLSTYLNGRTVPTWPQVWQIAQALGADLGEFSKAPVEEESANVG